MTICFWSPPQILFKILLVSAHAKCILKSSLITIIIYNCILLPLVPYKTPTWPFSRGISQHRIKTTYWSINLASILSNIYFLVNRIFKTNKRGASLVRFPTSRSKLSQGTKPTWQGNTLNLLKLTWGITRMWAMYLYLISMWVSTFGPQNAQKYRGLSYWT